jgi:hypothetical protein
MRLLAWTPIFSGLQNRSRMTAASTTVRCERRGVFNSYTPDMAPQRFSRLLAWPYGALVSVAAGLGVLALPAGVEGPHLIDISVGHAITAVDLVGIVPLLVGTMWLHAGFWSRRACLAEWVRESPGRATGVLCLGALGLGLLLASAFSAFFWWWAVGAILFVAMHVPVLVAAFRRRGAA